MLANKEYKDSGIVWLGHIPAHWDVTNYRRLFCRRKEYDDNPDKQVLSLTIEGVKRKNENFGKMAEDFTGHQIVRKDDLVFTPRDFDATPILSGIAPCDGCISNLYFVLYPRTPDIDVNFYNYFMWGVKWGGDIWKKLSYGMRFSYNYDQFCALPAIKIPLSEQKVIADYLDKECARIDDIVEKQRNIIEKLKEYKKSVITEAVTKGVNPNVKMKNSGIEWIGDIPEQYNLSKLKYYAKYITDGTHSTPEYIAEGVPFLSIKDISAGKLDFSDTKYISQKQHEELSKHAPIEKGDILFTIIGTLGISVIVDVDIAFDIFVSVGLLKPKDNINVKYLNYIMNSEYYYQYIQLVKAGEGTSAAKFNLSDVSNSPIIYPPLQEQQVISNYLDQKCAEIDSVIEKREKIIDLLTEYKKSLIYECVTGKKEVA